MTPQKRILREFSIDELSAVDRPAQTHARMTLMKREGKQEKDEMHFKKITQKEPHGFDTFEAAIAGILKREGCTRTLAMTKARKAHPDLYDDYQREGQDRIAKASEADSKARAEPKEVAAWEMLVSSIVGQDGVSRTEAMQRAARQHPDEFRAYQQA